MKKTFFLLLLSVIILTGCNNKRLEKNQFRVFGKIEDLGNAKGTINMPDASAERGIKRIEIEFKDGEFEYKGTIKEPEVVRFWLQDERVQKKAGRGYFPVKCGLLWFIANPGKEIEIKGNIKDFVNAYPYDGDENDVFAIFMKKAFPVINEEGNIMVENVTNKDLTEAQKNANNKKLEKLGEEEQQIRLAFLDKHISSVAALWLIEDMIIRSQIDMNKVDDYLKKVDQKYHSLSYYKNIEMRVDGFKSTQVGQMAPSIASSTNTFDGNPFDLKSMYGEKYTLIDFWGTW